MNTIVLDQTANFLARQVRRWDQRLRLLTSLVWVPRAVIVGLTFGVMLALLARLRPWLLPEQIAAYTVLVTLGSMLVTLVVIWLWPRSVAASARRFDYRFGLQERVSTALELTAGAIPLPDELGERQLDDAVNAAGGVNMRARLPLRVRWGELALLVVLAGVFAYLLLAPNPKADTLRAQRDLEAAIDAQSEVLEDTITAIEDDPDLSEAARDALTDPLREALATLQQEDISQQEAVAALAEAQQALDELADGMTPEQETAYQEAASEFAGSELTQDLAESMNTADLARMARDMDRLSDDLAQQDLTQEERDALAQRLENAAERLAQRNPALAEKLREAAEALRRGDVDAAQEALREAAEMLRDQHQQLQNSDMAQSARDTSQQLQQGQRELAGMNQADQPPDAGQLQQAQQQSGEQSEAGQMVQQDAQQTGSEGQQTAAEGESGTGQEPGAGMPEDGADGAAGTEGEEAGAAGAQAAAQPQSDAAQSGESEGGANAPAAGEGEGDAGADDVSGEAGGLDEGAQAANSSVDGGFETYDPQNEAFILGGEGEDAVDVGGAGTEPGEGALQEGEFGPNPQGEAAATYSGVFRDYESVVSDALESGRIPLDQRDVIREYFSSLAGE